MSDDVTQQVQALPTIFEYAAQTYQAMLEEANEEVLGAAYGEEEGLVPIYTTVSNQDDWDRYETLQWYAVAVFARENKNDPDLPAILARVNTGRTNYLRWGRDTLGWALYLFQKREDESL